MCQDTIRANLIRQAPKAEGAECDRAAKATKLANSEEAEAQPLDHRQLQVCWMTTSDPVCTVPVKSEMHVADLKACILQYAGVPVEEQRLFADGKEEELAVDADASSYPVLRLVRSASDPRVSDLGYFRPASTRFDRLASGNFTVVRKIAQGINGDIFRYAWRRDGEQRDVTVKKLRVRELEKQLGTERDERRAHLAPAQGAPEAEDALAEIGVLSYLAKQPDLPAYILRMLGVYSSDQHVWLVTEFCDGGELFEVAAAGGLQEAQAKVYMWQMLQGLAYLHKHSIGHRDVSLENALLKGGVVRLMDFGMAVKSHSSAGTPLRFFRAVGKNYYRAPECYVPAVSEITVTAPAASFAGDVAHVKVPGGYLCEVKLPEGSVPGRPCRAEVYGYAAQPADVFAVGVCAFILLFGNPPFGKALLSDALFSYLYGSGDGGLCLGKLLTQWHKTLPSADLMTLMADMMRPDSSRRPSAAECLESPWFAEMSETPVALHAPATDVQTPQGEAAALLGA